MLLQVTIENFLSFRDATTFSMLGANSDLSHAEHLAVDVAGKGKSLLLVAAIYGANAAGKSNLIKAINFAKYLIVEGARSRQTSHGHYLQRFQEKTSIDLGQLQQQ
jgi:uncharacterized protein